MVHIEQLQKLVTHITEMKPGLERFHRIEDVVATVTEFYKEIPDEIGHIICLNMSTVYTTNASDVDKSKIILVFFHLGFWGYETLVKLLTGENNEILRGEIQNAMNGITEA